MIENIETVVYFAALSICSFCVLLLIMSRHHIKAFPPILIKLMGLFSIGFVLQILLNSPQSYWKHLWMYLAICQNFLIGPVIWLYARQTMGKALSIKSIGIPKFVVLAAGILMASPLLLLIHSGPEWVASTHPTSVFYWDTYYALATGYVALYFIQAFWYISLIVKLLLNEQGQQLTLSALRTKTSEESTQIQVLRIILMGYLGIVLINAIRVFHCSVFGAVSLANQIQSLMDISVTVGILLLTIMKMMTNPSYSRAQKPLDPLLKLAQKYQHSSLDLTSRTRIQHKLLHAMSDPEIFTQNNLTLTGLAKILGERHHYVSQVINQDLTSSFFELVNRARVAHAQQLITQNTKLTIIDLTEQVGFNSKSTFYSAFAKYVGTTPAKYKLGLANT